MTKYPKSECEAHLDVKTDKPVCIICMGDEIEQLQERAETAERLAERLATSVLTALAGLVCTPGEGYLKALHCVGGDILALRNGSFAAGVVYALARLVEMHDEPGMARDILKESGVDVRYAAEHDVAFLRKEDPMLPKGRE